MNDKLGAVRKAGAAKAVGAPTSHQTFHCSVCGKDGDGDNLAEMLEHHQHIIHPSFYSHLRARKSLR